MSSPRIHVLPWLASVLLAGLTAAAGLYFGPPESLFSLGADRRTELQVQRGAAWFQRRCAGCHVTGDRGPDLSRIAETASTRRPGMGAEEYLLESILQPAAYQAPGSASRMPADAAEGLDAEAVRDLVAFLMSLGGRPDPGRIARLEIQPLPARDDAARARHAASVLRGQEVFQGKGGCAACHHLDRRTGNDRRAPSLFGVGQWSADELRTAILRPNQTVRRDYQQVAVRTDGGQTEVGRLILKRDGSCTVLVPASDGEPPLVLEPEDCPSPSDTEFTLLPDSPMPSGYEQILSPRDLEDLIAFLRSVY